MLHPLNPPACISELNHLIDWQKKVLEYARDHSRHDWSTFRSVLGDDFTDFILNNQNLSGNWGKAFRRFEQDLSRLVKCPRQDKQKVITDFNHDQTFFAHLDDLNFTFAFPHSISDAHKEAKNCLNAFYEFLSVGYPHALVPTHVGSLFRKQDVVVGYKQTNEFVEYVCPCCDSQWTDTPGGNEEGYTLEHYFHKKMYPSICLHPFNLVPMCSGCNSRRGEKDALNPDPSLRLLYTEIFHPIHRPVRNHAELTYQSTANGRELMGFTDLPGQSSSWADAIDAYGLLYEIPDRWQTLWKRVEQRIDRSLKACLRHFELEGKSLNVALFSTAIDRAIIDLEENFEHFNYPAARWLRWAKQHKFQDLCAMYDAY